MSFNNPLAPKRNNSAFIHDGPELFFHQREPLDRLLGGPNSAGRLQSHCHAGFLRIFADGARHHKADRQRRIGRLFTGRCLDEIRARHHGDEAGARDIAQREQIAGAKNDFHVGQAAGLLELGNFVVESLPLAAEHVGTSNDHINVVGPGFHRAADFGNAFGERRKSGGKSGGNRRHPHSAALKSAHRGLHEGVIDANSSDLDVELFNPQALHQVILDRMPGLRAKAPHAVFGIVAGKGSRSMHEMARNSHAACQSFLTVRRAT